jgi:hypothetical protein
MLIIGIFNFSHQEGVGCGVSKNGKKSFPIFGHINFYHEEHEG